MKSYEATLVDVEDLTLIYKTALDVDVKDEGDVNYLLGVIEGTLGKFFTVKKPEDKK